MKDFETKLFYGLTFVFLIVMVLLGVKVEKLENELDRCKSDKRVSTVFNSIPSRIYHSTYIFNHKGVI